MLDLFNLNKHQPDAPQIFAVYPDQEERAEESMIAQVYQPRLPTGAEVLRQQVNNESGSLVSMLNEVQPYGPQLLLKGDDTVYQEMIKRLEACEAEDIIIGNQSATYKGTDEGTGDVILHMEDGSYKILSTEKVYNNMNKDYANKDIIDLLEVNYSEADGKLYIKVKWHTGEETLIDAQALNELCYFPPHTLWYGLRVLSFFLAKSMNTMSNTW